MAVVGMNSKHGAKKMTLAENSNREETLFIPDSTVDGVMERLLGFGQRYGAYRRKGLDGRWKCIVLRSTENSADIQLHDLDYEIQGAKVSEAPYFSVFLQSEAEGVSLRYRYRIRPAVLIAWAVFLAVTISALWGAALFLCKIILNQR